jgi:predicted nicotinamide N-methyase
LKFNAAIQKVTIGDAIHHLYVPEIVSVKGDYESRRLEDPDAPFPYWARLWPSAIALSEFIAQHPTFITGKKVLEIAAGLGLPSLVAAYTAASVNCTDMDADAMELAKASAAATQLTNMHCDVLDWSDIPSGITADTLLLSDVNYEPEAFSSLLKLLTHFLNHGTTIVLSTPERLMAKPFIESLLEWTIQHERKQVFLEGQWHDITLLVLQHKL